jgi:uncharacterized membrane protein YebE (DUF533 family)
MKQLYKYFALLALGYFGYNQYQKYYLLNKNKNFVRNIGQEKAKEAGKQASNLKDYQNSFDVYLKNTVY